MILRRGVKCEACSWCFVVGWKGWLFAVHEVLLHHGLLTHLSCWNTGLFVVNFDCVPLASRLRWSLWGFLGSHHFLFILFDVSSEGAHPENSYQYYGWVIVCMASSFSAGILVKKSYDETGSLSQVLQKTLGHQLCKVPLVCQFSHGLYQTVNYSFISAIL